MIVSVVWYSLETDELVGEHDLPENFDYRTFLSLPDDDPGIYCYCIDEEIYGFTKLDDIVFDFSKFTYFIEVNQSFPGEKSNGFFLPPKFLFDDETIKRVKPGSPADDAQVQERLNGKSS